eukprot:TRINITY_DN1864_c0_g1_i1.p1 TRINITY_DN1864_c0_g1~~TRINITY_DN1864_c0_g1_i1.p1  ORF type:complete len:271 (-),score=8.11 TRINITY_DN1864_c0_g1_i1:2-814(-)
MRDTICLSELVFSKNVASDIEDDVLFSIFSYLDVRSLGISAAPVCKQWASVASEPQLWHFFAMRDIPLPYVPSRAKREASILDWQALYRKLTAYQFSEDQVDHMIRLSVTGMAASRTVPNSSPKLLYALAMIQRPMVSGVHCWEMTCENPTEAGKAGVIFGISSVFHAHQSMQGGCPYYGIQIPDFMIYRNGFQSGSVTQPSQLICRRRISMGSLEILLESFDKDRAPAVSLPSMQHCGAAVPNPFRVLHFVHTSVRFTLQNAGFERNLW